MRSFRISTNSKKLYENVLTCSLRRGLKIRPYIVEHVLRYLTENKACSSRKAVVGVKIFLHKKKFRLVKIWSPDYSQGQGGSLPLLLALRVPTRWHFEGRDYAIEVST